MVIRIILTVQFSRFLVTIVTEGPQWRLCGNPHETWQEEKVNSRYSFHNEKYVAFNLVKIQSSSQIIVVGSNFFIKNVALYYCEKYMKWPKISQNTLYVSNLLHMTEVSDLVYLAIKHVDMRSTVFCSVAALQSYQQQTCVLGMEQISLSLKKDKHVVIHQSWSQLHHKQEV